jgi:hypothetical protein
MIIEYLDKAGTNTIAIAFTGEASAIDHELVMQLWIKLQVIGDPNLPVAKVLMQAIADLLPRRDVKSKGFKIKGLTEKMLRDIFFGEECQLIQEHKPRLEQKKRDVTIDGAPIPPSGDPTADLLAQMTRQFGGSFIEAKAAIESMSYNAIAAYQQTYAEVCRDPEERTKEYILNKYYEQVESDPLLKMAVLGMD